MSEQSERAAADGGSDSRGRQAERRLLDFACASSDWFWEMDEELRFAWFSPEAEGSLRVARTTLVGKHRWDLAADLDETEKWHRHRADLTARRPFRDFRYRARTPAGIEVYISVSGVPVRNAAGVFNGYRGSGCNITAEVLAEQKAERAQLLLQDAVESITHGFALFDAEDRLVLCNANYRRALSSISDVLRPGVQFEHLARTLVRRGYIALPEDLRETWLNERLRKRASGPGSRTYQTADGSWIEIREYATRDGGRAVIRADISQQKQAEEALRRSEARLADAQRLAGVGSWELTITANTMTWSAEFCHICGVHGEDRDYDAFLNLVHPEDRPEVMQRIDAAVHAGAAFTLEHRIVRSDRSIRHVVHEGEVHFDAAGVPVTMLGTVQDITERRIAEQRLREVEQRFRVAFETSADALCISRLHDGLLIDVNPAFESLFGHPKRALIGRTSVDAGIWHSVEQRAAFQSRVLEEGAVRNLVTQNVRRDGRMLTVLISSSLCLLDGTPHLVTSIRDISELERVQAELRKLWQAVEQSSAAVIMTDGSGRIEYVNASFSSITGYSRGEACGQLPSILKSGLTPDDTYRSLWATIAGGGNWQGEFCNRRKDGSLYWASASISAVKGSKGTITHFIGVQSDISARKHAEEKLRVSEERYRSLIETSLFGICIEQDGRAVFANQTFAEIFGYAEPGDILALESVRALYLPEDVARANRHEPAEGLGLTGSSQFEMRGIRRDGMMIWLHTQNRIIPWNGHNALQRTVVDITLRKRYEDRLLFQANYDAVTELPNRLLALDRLTSAIAQARRRRTRVAVLFIDVDHFKKVNDTLGHDVGDQFLRQVGQRLRNAVREEDIVARLGGDEFIVVLPDIRLRKGAEAVAEKIVGSMSQPFLLHGQEAFVTVSVGVAIYPDDASDADGLMRNADAAMYVAKDEGRGTVRFFSPKLRERDHNRMRLEAALRHALNRRQLRLYYQPLVDIASGRIIGAEALLRWFSPEFGNISPDQFIRLAEDTGLIVPIGAWVLASGCRELKRWHTAGFDRIGLSVNVSSRQFRGTSLIQAVSDALALNDLRPEHLELEITESLLMDHLEDIRSTVNRLQRCGVRLAVDDFGTGYSSLSYLNRFPLNTLKIDRSFTAGMLTDAAQATLVDALIVLAHRLELQVTAEGVETTEQLEFLRARGCDIAQGYLFSRPLPAEGFLELLNRNGHGAQRRPAI